MAEVEVSQTVRMKPREGGRKLPQYIAALAATLGALASGSALGWSSPVMFKITQENSTDYNFPVSTGSVDWISSLVNLGAARASIPIHMIMNALGRKKTMLHLVMPFTMGWLQITFAPNAFILMAGRFTTGLAGGALFVLVPAYISEIAQDSIRGTLGSYFQLMVTIGILFAYSVGSYTSVFVFNIICTCIPIIFGVVLFFMPESPNFLVTKERNDEAREALVRLRGNAYDVDGELNALKQRIEDNQNNQVSYLSVIKKKTTLKAILICFALMLFQQLSGINAVIFNTSAIFASAGTAIPAAVATIIIGVIQVVSTFVSSLVVDKLGRRIFLLLSILIMCLCSTAVGVFFFLQDVHGVDSSVISAISWLPLVALSLFIIAFSIGLGPIPWMIAGELCTIKSKVLVSSMVLTLNWLFSFAVTSFFNALNAKIGTGQVFWLFASVMVVGFLFVFFIVPETKGKSVDEIQVMLGAEPQQKTKTECNEYIT